MRSRAGPPACSVARSSSSNADTARQLHTLFSAFQVDQIPLAPNGREIWCTSEAEGRINVFDAETHEKMHITDVPYSGDPHGFVCDHDDDVARVMRDQGGFHDGIDPGKGPPL